MKGFAIFVTVYGPCKIAAVAAVLIICCLNTASAQPRGAGLYSSPRGFGISYEKDAKGESGGFSTFTLYADIYGLSAERTPHPGIKFNASRLFLIETLSGNEASFTFYVGPGLSAGYVHDFEKEYWQDYYEKLTKKAGAVFALSGTFGCRFNFNRAIAMDLSFTAEAGMHLRSENGSTKLALYKNGLIQTIYPQLTIYMLF